MLNRTKLINICWYLVIISIGANYFSNIIFSLEIASIIGCLLIFSDDKIRIQRKDMQIIFFMFMFSFGIYTSRLLFTPEISIIINVLFLIKITFFFLFVYFFISKYKVPYETLYCIMFFVIPHFLAYLSGSVALIDGQFPGLHSDPNYSSPDYLSSFIASLVLFYKRNIVFKQKVFFLGFLLISIFMIFLSASRTAIIACFTVFLLFYIFKLYKSNKSFLFKNIFFVIFALLFISIFLDFFENLHFLDKIIARFSDSEGGSSLMENERYIVWGITFDLINTTGLFQGYGTENFLQRQYYFGAHNAWLDIGTKMGSYTFYSHILITFLGLISLFIKFIKNIKKLEISSIESFFIFYVIGVSVMIFSISVSFLYHYWFLIFLLFIFIFRPLPLRNN